MALSYVQRLLVVTRHVRSAVRLFVLANHCVMHTCTVRALQALRSIHSSSALFAAVNCRALKSLRQRCTELFDELSALLAICRRCIREQLLARRKSSGLRDPFSCLLTPSTTPVNFLSCSYSWIRINLIPWGNLPLTTRPLPLLVTAATPKFS